jgi:hypothetical protein
VVRHAVKDCGATGGDARLPAIFYCTCDGLGGRERPPLHALGFVLVI